VHGRPTDCTSARPNTCIANCGQTASVVTWVAWWLSSYGIGYETERSTVQFPANALPSCSHLPACIGATGLVVGVNSQLSGCCRSFASNLEQVANLLCAQANSVSYASWDGKWVVTYRLRSEGLVWLIGAVVCLLAQLQTVGPVVRLGVQWMAPYCAVVSLAHANQLPLPRL